MVTHSSIHYSYKNGMSALIKFCQVTCCLDVVKWKRSCAPTKAAVSLDPAWQGVGGRTIHVVSSKWGFGWLLERTESVLLQMIPVNPLHESFSALNAGVLTGQISVIPACNLQHGMWDVGKWRWSDFVTPLWLRHDSALTVLPGQRPFWSQKWLEAARYMLAVMWRRTFTILSA